MPEVKWIKLSTLMFDDEKIKLIEAMPDRDTILIIWIKLLSQAGKCNASGYLLLNQSIPYTDEMLSTIFNRPLNTVRMALDIFNNFGMIDIEENAFRISNWEKHQNIEGMDKIREQNRERKRRQREKQKLLPDKTSRDSRVTSHENHAIDIDIELDKEYILLSDYLQESLKILSKIKNYPFEIKEDIKFLNKLETDFPKLDLLKAIKQWDAYILDKPFKNNSRPRSQLRTAFSKYAEWNKCLKQVDNDLYREVD